MNSNERRRNAAKRIWTVAGVGVAAALATTAVCAVSDIDAARAQATPSWHVLVYTVNDSTSDLPLGYDLDEMVAASRAGVTFTVYADNSDATDFPSQYVATTGGAVIIEIADGVATVTDQLGELDSGSPDTLGWFVAAGLQRHPTDRSALVVWDHGSGWQGIAFDEDVTATGEHRRASYLDAEELGRAVDAGLAAAGRDAFDMLVLDACLMATLEVVSETATNARYLVASEELVPGLGLNYEAFSVFATEPAADALRIFDVLANGFRDDIAAEAPDQSDMITLSLTDLSKAAALEQAVLAFSQAAAVDVTANTAAYMAAARQGVRYGLSGGDWAGFLDLGEYLGGLGTASSQVASARTALLAALDAAVLDQIGSESYATATGLTVYFPTEPREYDEDYDLQPTAQLWRPFLEAFYDAQAEVVVNTDIGFTAANLTVEPTANGWYAIDAPITADFNGTIELLAALPDANGNLTYFEADAGQVVDGRASARFLPTLTTVSDGTSSAVPFTRYVTEPDGAHGYSQFTLQRQDGTIANLNWDRVADASTGPFTIVDPLGTMIGYTPLPGDLAYPIVMLQRPGEQPVREATAPALDLNASWTVTDDALPPGQSVYLELQLRDAAGAIVDRLSTYVTVAR